LQYTSGSTAQPKGVMITHANLLHNLNIIQTVCNVNPATHIFSWLPPYHDMGLIASILEPLYAGVPVTLMSTIDFIARPSRWVEAISKYQCTLTGAPNFAYELCVLKTPEHVVKTLDLSSLELAANGAEAISVQSLQLFYEKFKSAGLRQGVIFPCYGLAESTVMVSATKFLTGEFILNVDPNQLKNNIIKLVAAHQPHKQLVSVGKPQLEVQIINPNTLLKCEDFEVGEIWVSGESVAKGYYNDPIETSKIFHGVLKEDLSQKKYLRTGDLGFIHQGELFICGRFKNLIIIKGQNYYPQDIEQAVIACDKSIRHGCVIAYSTIVDGLEQLVIVAEIRSKTSENTFPEIIEHIKKAITNEFHIIAHSIYLVTPQTIPKTTSGKLQHHKCKELVENHLITILYSYSGRDIKSHPSSENMLINQDKNKLLHILNSESEEQQKVAIVELIKSITAQILSLDIPSSIDVNKEFFELGMDSLMIVDLLNRIYIELNTVLDVSVSHLSESRNIEDLANHVLKGIAKNAFEKKVNKPKNNASQLAKLAQFNSYDRYHELKKIKKNCELILGKNQLLFGVNQGISKNTIFVAEQKYINFSGYNYLGMSGDPFVMEQTKQAIDKYGTSVSASRVASGEITLHGKLESAISHLNGTEDTIVFVGGHTTNVEAISYLFGPKDIIFHDALAHHSIIHGAEFSGAMHLSFSHNDWDNLEQLLIQYRDQYERSVIIIEGVYSMDGDIPSVPELIVLKKKYYSFLMIDEAHSMGTIGKTGCGIREYYDLEPSDVDLWMGTLSKSFASCGGYISGNAEVVELLKYSASGFVYSVGLSPPNTASALASMELMIKEPTRVKMLQNNAGVLLKKLKENNVNTGLSCNSPVIPLITGSSEKAIRLSYQLKQAGVYAIPIFSPAVAENAARVRLFISSTHTEEQIEAAGQIIVSKYTKIMSG
jgi:8-amino-7-oxononanoate synthase